jgi:hypothetical protein
MAVAPNIETAQIASRKKFEFSLQNANLPLTPTKVQSKLALMVEDYRLKVSITPRVSGSCRLGVAPLGQVRLDGRMLEGDVKRDVRTAQPEYVFPQDALRTSRPLCPASHAY